MYVTISRSSQSNRYQCQITHTRNTQLVDGSCEMINEPLCVTAYFMSNFICRRTQTRETAFHHFALCSSGEFISSRWFLPGAHLRFHRNKENGATSSPVERVRTQKVHEKMCIFTMTMDHCFNAHCHVVWARSRPFSQFVGIYAQNVDRNVRRIHELTFDGKFIAFFFLTRTSK